MRGRYFLVMSLWPAPMRKDTLTRRELHEIRLSGVLDVGLMAWGVLYIGR